MYFNTIIEIRKYWHTQKKVRINLPNFWKSKFAYVLVVQNGSTFNFCCLLCISTIKKKNSLQILAHPHQLLLWSEVKCIIVFFYSLQQSIIPTSSFLILSIFLLLLITNSILNLSHISKLIKLWKYILSFSNRIKILFIKLFNLISRHERDNTKTKKKLNPWINLNTFFSNFVIFSCITDQRSIILRFKQLVGNNDFVIGNGVCVAHVTLISHFKISKTKQMFVIVFGFLVCLVW